MKIAPMQKYLVVSIITSDRAGLAEYFTELASDHQCNVEDSRMSILGNEFVASMLLKGNSENIEQVSQAYTKLNDSNDYLVQLKETTEEQVDSNSLPYYVHAITVDGLGIIQKVTDFMAQNNINIESLQTESYKAPHTGTPMLEIAVHIYVPTTAQINELKERFASLCDELNLDSSFEAITH